MMDQRKPDPPIESAAELRRRAEARVAAATGDLTDLSPKEIRALVHELRVHQVELEMQNEALQAAQYDLSEARDRYFDLYECAPVGYLALDVHGVIRSSNLTAAELLGIERKQLIGTRFEMLLAAEHRDASYLLLRRSATVDERQTTELRLENGAGITRWVRAEVGWHQADDNREGEWRVALHEITRQKAAEEALRKSEARLRLAAQAAAMAAFSRDYQTGEDYWSPEFLVLFGRTPHETLPLEDDIPAAVHPDDRPGALAAVRSCLDRTAPPELHLEHRIVHPDGQVRWVLMRGRVEFDANGRPRSSYGFAFDITRRKEMETQLQSAEQEQRRQRELLERIIETIPVMVVLWDPRFQRFTLNRCARALLGWSNADANEGDFMSKVYPDPADRAEAGGFMQSLDSGWHELHPTAKSGERIPSDWANVQLTDHTMVGIGVDLRERQRAEAKLRASEDRYRTLFNSIDEGFCVVEMLYDADGRPVDYRFLEANPAFAKQTGLGDVVGRTMRELAPAHEDEWFTTYDRIARSRQPERFEGEAAQLQRWYDVYAFPMGAPAERRVAVLFNDITARRAVEQERERLNETLEDQVAERTSLLTLHNDVASAANAAQSIDDALASVLRLVSEHNGWCFGHAYLIEDGDRVLLVPVRSYYESAPGRFQRFREVTRGLRLRPGEGLPGRAFAARAVQWSDDVREELVARRADVGYDLGVRCGAAFPIFSGAEVVGVLEFFSDHQIEPTDRLIQSMASIGTQVGRVVERQRFERQVARALLAEQERLGRDLHDTVGQDIAGLALITERIAQQAHAGQIPHPAALTELAEILRAALQNTRAVVRGMLPFTFAHGEAFDAALEELAATTTQRHNVACTVHCPGPIGIDGPDVAVHLLRIAAEAVANAVKHARAGRIDLHLMFEDEMMRMEVRDDGVGIPDEVDPGGSGLSIMQHRANVIGATLKIRRAPGGGTIVTCVLPKELLRLRPAEEAKP